MKRLQKLIINYWLIAKQNSVKISKLLKKQLIFRPVTRGLMNIWCYYSRESIQSTTRVMITLSVWFLTAYYVQNSILLKCALGNSTIFRKISNKQLNCPLSFFALDGFTLMSDRKVCSKRDSCQSWLRAETFEDQPPRY